MLERGSSKNKTFDQVCLSNKFAFPKTDDRRREKVFHQFWRQYCCQKYEEDLAQNYQTWLAQVHSVSLGRDLQESYGNEKRARGKYSRKLFYREAPPPGQTPSPFVYLNKRHYQRTSSITRRDFNQKTSVICSVHVVVAVKIIRLPNPFLYLE